MATTERKRLPGCEACRDKHIKCDRKDPCTQCDKKKIRCVRAVKFRFRHSFNPSIEDGSYEFAGSQRWCSVQGKRLKFIDETVELSANYEHGSALSDPDADAPEPMPFRDSDPEPDPGRSVDRGRRRRASAAAPRPAANTPPDAAEAAAARRSSEANNVPIDPLLQTHNNSNTPSATSRHSDSSTRHNPPPPPPSLPSLPSLPPLQPPPPPPPPASSRFPDHADGLSIGRGGQVRPSAIYPGRNSGGGSDPGAIYADGPGPAPACLGLCLGMTAGPSRFPLKNRHEADLLRHYAARLAPALDYCDPESHFAYAVPEAARRSHPLTIVVNLLATKSLKASGGGGSSSSSSDGRELWSMAGAARHQQACLPCFMSATNFAGDYLPEPSFAAIVLLRFLTGVAAPAPPAEEETHLIAMRAALATQSRYLCPGGFHQAVFWAGVRQEIHLAIVHQRSVGLRLETPPHHHGSATTPTSAATMPTPTTAPADDHAWAHRILLHLLDVIDFCFGGDADRRAAVTYDGLVEYSARWMTSKPESFSPVFFREPRGGGRAGEVFPRVAFLTDTIAAALQYYYLVRILLTAHNPKIPRLGQSHKLAVKAIDNEIRADARILCGIAETADQVHPSYTVATSGIWLAGDRFSNEVDQRALFDILLKTEETFGWSTEAIRSNLEDTWGWSEGRDAVMGST